MIDGERDGPSTPLSAHDVRTGTGSGTADGARPGAADAPVLDSLVAIDVHTHVLASVTEPAPAANEGNKALADHFGAPPIVPTVPDLARYYAEQRMMCVVFPVNTTWASGREQRVSNDEVCEQAALFPDVIIPFCSVDPHGGRAAAKEVRRLAAEYPVKGLKFHPNSQEFFPNDRDVYPIYEAAEEAGLVALFHSGQTGVGAGQRGGGGIRLKYSNPLHVDDVAVDFPDLKIILAHPSFPWQDEALSIAGHKPNVHIDLSGWSPKYFPPTLVQHARTLLKRKVLFGSDYPVITPARWLADFDRLGFDERTRALILKENAAALLGLTAEVPR
jgi:predicted TIM-barrel fold metal-dependent hydrolase